MIITQTVDIPADRRLIIEVPYEIPAGKAQVELKVIPFTKKEEISEPAVKESYPDNNGKLRLTKKELDEMLDKSPITRELTGILSDLGDITIEQIREERLAKYLK